MDLSLFLAVLWRSKRLVFGGLFLGVVLAVLAYGQPSFAGGKPKLVPRGAEVWQSESQLLIAQAGFPYGETTTTTPSVSLNTLSPVYANVANGNLIQSEIRQQLGTVGTVKANEVIDAAASTNLPFVTFVASAPTGSLATKLAAGAAVIFQAYVARQQASAKIPRDRRVQLSIVESGTKPKLVEGHKLSIPILVFLAVMLSAISLVLMRENVRKSRAAAQREHAPFDDAPYEQTAHEPHVGVSAPASGYTSVPHEYATALSSHDGGVGIHRNPVEAGNA
jgi:hypothetical protein